MPITVTSKVIYVNSIQEGIAAEGCGQAAGSCLMGRHHSSWQKHGAEGR